MSTVNMNAAESRIPRAKRPLAVERRSHSRHAVNDSATIILFKIVSRLAGRIVDLSLGGCRIHCHERFPVGIYTAVEIEFKVDGISFRLGGVVQVIHDRRTVGIRFLDMSHRKREHLEQLIREIQEWRSQKQTSDSR
jgi:c-di-GMP-binding flagellar brake protein YcgR